MRFKIVQSGPFWFVRRKWWDLGWPPFAYGSGPFDEREIPFFSKDIAEAAVKKYPQGKLVVDLIGLPVDGLLTREGQQALLDASSATSNEPESK